MGIIPRVIRDIFNSVQRREAENPNSTYVVRVQFLEIYGEEIRDLLDSSRSSRISIRETPSGDIEVIGACEELIDSPQHMIRLLIDGSRHRTTASTLMNLTSSRSHGMH